MDAKLKELVEHMTISPMIDGTIMESEGLSTSIWDKYLPLASKSTVKSGTYLLRIGEILHGFYFIKKGQLDHTFLSKDGATKTFLLMGEGALFGEQFILHGQPGLFEGRVTADAELYFFDQDTAYKIMKEDFDISLFVMKSMGIKSRMLAIQVEDMSFRSILQKISRILYCYCCYEEKRRKVDKDIILELSHQKLANMLASHRVTITNNLAKLKKQGVLYYKYEKIIIKDKQKLKEIAFE